MLQKVSCSFLVVLALGLSFAGIILVLPLATCKPAVQWSFPWRKPLIGSLLALICISGIFAAFFPEKCSKIFHGRRREKTQALKDSSSHMVGVHFKGHHPNCGNFNAHLIRMNGRVLCAACTGLLLGGVLVLVGTAFYFFLGGDVLGKFGLWSAFVGQIGVALGFFQFKFRGFIRFILNAFFVIACFLVLVGSDALAENVFIDLYVICLIVFWLFTRISISQWDHSRICRFCKLPCKLNQK